jgi:hypothetical protein
MKYPAGTRLVVIISAVAIVFLVLGIYLYQNQVVSTKQVQTICTEMAEGTIVLTILNSTTQNPISNVSAKAVTLSSNGFPAPCVGRLVAEHFVTGENGTVSFCCDTGNYNITVSYSGLTYFIQTEVSPEIYTCVTLYIPSGKSNITMSQDFAEGCPSS